MTDIDRTLDRLSRSRFRGRFALSPADRAYLADHGLEAIVEHAAGFVAKRLAPAMPENDGKQTPMRGHPVFVAQHATATCCRGCLAKWHGIQPGTAIDREQQAYIVAVIARWLALQGIADDPPRAPRLL